MSGKSRPHTVSTRRPSQAPRTHAADRADVRRAASAPPESTTRDNVTNGVRLNKAIAAAGLCSRRKADELILAGQVRINGTLEENPARRVLPGDRIAVNDRELAAAQEYYYLLLHKPVQTVCTVNDPEGRPTVMAYLPPEVRHLRLYPVGRLDYFSEGLLLLTNDGELAQRLTHPRHHQPKTYEVLIRGSVPETALAVMRRGMRLDEGQALLPVDVEAKTAENGNTLLRMVLRQGVNRQIRRMCRDLGLTILRLRRVAQGPLALGNLKPGAARALTIGEVADLRQSVGLPSQV